MRNSATTAAGLLLLTKSNSIYQQAAENLVLTLQPLRQRAFSQCSLHAGGNGFALVTIAKITSGMVSNSSLGTFELTALLS